MHLYDDFGDASSSLLSTSSLYLFCCCAYYLFSLCRQVLGGPHRLPLPLLVDPEDLRQTGCDGLGPEVLGKGRCLDASEGHFCRMKSTHYLENIFTLFRRHFYFSEYPFCIRGFKLFKFFFFALKLLK